MKVLRLSTQLHKWVALVVGLQVLFWVGGGLVMTVIPIETVRSEHRAAKLKPALLEVGALPTLAVVARRAGVAPVEAELRTTPRPLDDADAEIIAGSPAGGPRLLLDARRGNALEAFVDARRGTCSCSRGVR